MKSAMFIFFLLVLFCCSLKTKENLSEENAIFKSNVAIEKVILHHVSLVDIFTVIDVPCEDFEKVFATSFKKDTIIEPNEIALLKTYMNKLKAIDSLSIKSMDTRAKFYFISSLDTTEYCLNSGIVYSNGIYYEISNELFDYVENFRK